MQRTAIISVLGLILSGCQTTQKTQKKDATPGDTLRPRVEVKTTLGDFVVELDIERAPAASMHFAQYIEKKFYDGTIFHRIPEVPVIIQGGGFTPDMEAKNARYSTAFPGHWNPELSNRKWSVAMLRGQGPAGTGTAEFFVNVGDNWMLDERNDGHRFAVMGEVVDGQETVEKIRNVPIGTHPKYAEGQSRVVPTTPIVITSVRLLNSFDFELARAKAEAMQKAPSDPVVALMEKLEKDSGAKPVRTESGIIYFDFVTGMGATPFISDWVQFHYTGTFLNGAVFESTRDGEPFTRELSKLNVGMMELMLSMKEGTRRTAIVPPELAYGSAGIPGIIPPGATLVYDIELLGIVGPDNP